MEKEDHMVGRILVELDLIEGLLLKLDKDTEWRNWKFQQKLECWRLFFCCVFFHEVGCLKNDSHQVI